MKFGLESFDRKCHVYLLKLIFPLGCWHNSCVMSKSRIVHPLWSMNVTAELGIFTCALVKLASHDLDDVSCHIV